MKTSYPPAHLAFAIQQHVAPRIIKLQNFIGKPIEVYNSIIAGCRQSIPMTRVYLQQGIENVVKNDKGEIDISAPGNDLRSTRESELQDCSSMYDSKQLAKTQVYVDDCTQTSMHRNGGIVFNKLGNSFFQQSQQTPQMP